MAAGEPNSNVGVLVDLFDSADITALGGAVITGNFSLAVYADTQFRSRG